MLYLSPFITAYFLIIAAVLGSIFGSFICCFAYRFVNGESVLKGRSKCDSCRHVLGALDLIPIVSYIALGGKCRYCKNKVSPVSLLSEIILSIAFVLLVLRYNISAELLRALAFSCVLLAVALIDMESFIIPDKLILFGIAIWVVSLPFLANPLKNVTNGIIGGTAIAFGLFTLSIIFDKMTGKDSLGGGDIKLFFVTGLYLGVIQNLLNLFIACILGIIFAAVYKRNRTEGTQNTNDSSEKAGRFSRPVPFGPAIAAATLVTMLVGEYISSWYLSLF